MRRFMLVLRGGALFLLGVLLIPLLSMNWFYIKKLDHSLERISRDLGTIRGIIDTDRLARHTEPRDTLTREQASAFDRIEGQIAKGEKGWPGTVADAESLRASLGELIKSMDAATQQAVLPRLFKLRWAVETIRTIRRAVAAGRPRA